MGDSPGTYEICHANTALTEGIAVSPPILKHLAVGTMVDVVEVVRCAEDQRVRARIRIPAGWISLMDTKDGYRWAKKLHVTAAPSATPSATPRPPMERQHDTLIKCNDSQRSSIGGSG